MIELKPASRKGTDAISAQSTDTQVTAQRMLTLLLDVLRSSESDLSRQDDSTGTVPVESDGMGNTGHGAAQLKGDDDGTSYSWKTHPEDPENMRQQLRHLLDPPTEPGTSSTDPLASLQSVAPATEMEALQTWLALSQLSDLLGPGQLAGIERQTDLQALPGEVLQAIEMHLDDDRLSSFGKVLRIGHLLLGQGFPSQ